MPEYSCLKPYACSSVTAIAPRSFFYRAVASWNSLTVVRQETLHLFIVLYCIVRPRKNKSISNEVTDILSTAPVTKSLQVWGCWLFQHGRNFKGKRSTILRDNSRFKHCP